MVGVAAASQIRELSSSGSALQQALLDATLCCDSSRLCAAGNTSILLPRNRGDKVPLVQQERSGDLGSESYSPRTGGERSGASIMSCWSHSSHNGTDCPHGKAHEGHLEGCTSAYNLVWCTDVPVCLVSVHPGSSPGRAASPVELGESTCTALCMGHLCMEKVAAGSGDARPLLQVELCCR